MKLPGPVLKIKPLLLIQVIDLDVAFVYLKVVAVEQGVGDGLKALKNLGRADG